MSSRRFQLEDRFTDPDGTEDVIIAAWGVVFPDGSAVVRWHKQYGSTDVYETGHEAVLIRYTQYDVVWLDPESFVEVGMDQPSTGRHAEVEA